MILCLGTTPAAQRVMVFRQLSLNAVNRAALTLDGIAGKAINVAKVLKTLGQTPFVISFVGGAHGEVLRAALASKHIEAELVAVSAPTRQCLTVIDQAAGTHTELVEESRAVTPSDFNQFFAAVRQRMAGCRAAVMSGTIAPGCPQHFYRDAVRLAETVGALSVVDAQGMALAAVLEAHPGLVKPNRTELAATLGRELKSDDEVKAAMRELCERGAQRVVVTAGRMPTLAFDGKKFAQIFPPPIRPANPIGSGDAFTAAVVWRLLRGDDLAEACRWGTAAGAANALTLMPGELERDEVERLVKDTVVA